MLEKNLFYDKRNNVSSSSSGDIQMSRCFSWNKIDKRDPDWNHRVGSVMATKHVYGPGVYNSLAYVPKI